MALDHYPTTTLFHIWNKALMNAYAFKGHNKDESMFSLDFGKKPDLPEETHAGPNCKKGQ